MKISASVLALLLGVAGIASAQEQSPACQRRSEVVASCFTVRGRLSYWNGSPSARIWRVGTHRMLGVHRDELPKEIVARMSGFDTELLGDFEVCPFRHERPGHMQFICVESWRNIKVRPRQQ
jgi:hypothetical protein